MSYDDELRFFLRRVGAVFGLVATVVILVLLLWPRYRVWQREMSGRAQLAEAKWNRTITIEEAKAKRAAAQELAQAEVERAKGVAQANKIIGDSLAGNDAYLRYLWIQGLSDGNGETVYIPTEAGLPILEAGKRRDRPAEVTP